jgi:hypothetical protein
MTHVKSSTITIISEERTVYIIPVKVFLDFSDAEYGRNYTPSMESQSPIPVAARSKAWGAATRFMGLGIRIPPGAWMSLTSVVYC